MGSDSVSAKLYYAVLSLRIIPPSPLDKKYYMYYISLEMDRKKHRPNLSIRLDPEALKRAKMAAAASESTIGKWLEEAIEEKIQRQRKTNWETKWYNT